MHKRLSGLFTGLFITLCSLCLPAGAEQAPQSYVKLAIGNARSDIDVWGRENDTAAALAYGMRFHSNLDVEVGYINFGKARYRSGADTLSTDSESVFVAVVGRYPLQQAFSVYGKLGASYHWNEWSGTLGGVPFRDKDGRLAPMLGLGLSWQFMPNWAADLDYSYFHRAGKDEDRSANIDMVSVGLKFLF